MRICLFFVLLFMCTGLILGEKEEIEDDANRKRILEQLTKTRTVLLDDYHLVTRQIATDVYMFRSYRTVSVVFYPVMRDVTDAHFSFQSEELHLNNLGRCHANTFFFNKLCPGFILLNEIFLIGMCNYNWNTACL